MKEWLKLMSYKIIVICKTTIMAVFFCVVNAQTSSFTLLPSSMLPISTPLVSTLPISALSFPTQTILPSSSNFGREAESSSVSAPITTTGLPQPSSSPMNSPQVTPAAATTQPQEVNVGLFAGIAVSVAVLVLLVILTAVMLLVCAMKKKRENKGQGGMFKSELMHVHVHIVVLYTYLLFVRGKKK